MVLTLTKTEQLILVEMFKNNFLLDQCKIDMDNSRLYKCLAKLSHLDLITIRKSPTNKRSKIYKLTDIGIVLASNISELDKPNIIYTIIVKII